MNHQTGNLYRKSSADSKPGLPKKSTKCMETKAHLYGNALFMITSSATNNLWQKFENTSSTIPSNGKSTCIIILTKTCSCRDRFCAANLSAPHHHPFNQCGQVSDLSLQTHPTVTSDCTLAINTAGSAQRTCPPHTIIPSHNADRSVTCPYKPTPPLHRIAHSR